MRPTPDGVASRRSLAGSRPVSVFGAALLVLLAIPWPGAAGVVTGGVWIGGNALLVVVAAVWALGHPRAWVHGIPSLWRWGFWLALGASLAGYAAGGSALSLLELAPPAPAALFTIGLGLFPAALAAAFVTGWSSLAIAAFLSRRAPAPIPPRYAPGVWWLCTMLLMMVEGLLRVSGVPATRSPLPLAGVPVISALLYRAYLRSGRPPRVLAAGLTAWMTRSLMVRVGWPGRSWMVDLRGAAIGLLAGVCLATIQSLALMRPAQASVLATLVRMRASTRRSVTEYVFDPEASRSRSRLFLFQMDPAAMRFAMRRSEAALQARAIRALIACRPAAIVLPEPDLHGSAATPFARAVGAQADAHDPGVPRVLANMRDMGDLIGATRAAGSVIVVAPDTPAPPGRLRQVSAALEAAAAACGPEGLADLGGVHVPVMRTRWSPPRPAWMAVRERLLGRAIPTVPGPRGTLAAILRDPAVPSIAPGRVLVDFASDDPARELPAAPYSALLDPGPMSGLRASFDPDAVRGHVVLLDTLAYRTRSTPVGTVSEQSAFAHAVATVIDGATIGEASPAALFLLVVATGTLVGAWCVRRPPMEAGWRAAAVVLALGSYSVYACVVHSLWVDAVAPGTAAVVALMVTTELTFVMERRARDANRSMLERFVAPEVVGQLLADPESEVNVGGRRQLVCVLFVDIRDFARFAERSTPEEVLEVVNTFMTELPEVVFRHGGILDKYTGDGLMAIFRVPTGDPAEVLRSVSAALEMRDAAARIASEQEAAGRDRLGVGIGLHCGEAVVGLVGNPRHVNYTAIGHTVVVAERLQSVAAAGEVIVSADVVERTGDRIVAVPRDEVLVKGGGALVQCYTAQRLADDPVTSP